MLSWLRYSALFLLALSLLNPFASAVSGTEASIFTTSSVYGFTPNQGGAGTIVQVTGHQVFFDKPLTVTFGIPVEFKTYEGFTWISRVQPIGIPSAVQPNLGGDFVTDIAVPCCMPDGNPIGKQQLVLAILMEDGSLYATDSGVKLFDFMPGALPPTGESAPILWVVILSSILALVVGFVIIRMVKQQENTDHTSGRA